MHKDPSISVIIPHYNRSHLIGTALDSVRQQTLQPAEILVVDDASAAEHRARLQQHGESVKLLQLGRNAGAAQARNIGIEAAKGEYLAFLDDDDCWLPNKLELQWNALQSDCSLDAVAGPMSMHYDNGAEGVLRSHSGRIITLRGALEGTPALLQTLVIRTKTMRDLGGFDARFRIMEDQDLWIRFTAAGFKALYMDEVLACLDRREMERLTAKWERYIAAQLDLTDKHRELYEEVYGTGGARRHRSKILRRSGVHRGRIKGRLTYIHGCVVERDWRHLLRFCSTGRMIDIPYENC